MGSGHVNHQEFPPEIDRMLKEMSLADAVRALLDGFCKLAEKDKQHG